MEKNNMNFYYGKSRKRQ